MKAPERCCMMFEASVMRSMPRVLTPQRSRWSRPISSSDMPRYWRPLSVSLSFGSAPMRCMMASSMPARRVFVSSRSVSTDEALRPVGPVAFVARGDVVEDRGAHGLDGGAFGDVLLHLLGGNAVAGAQRRDVPGTLPLGGRGFGGGFVAGRLLVGGALGLQFGIGHGGFL
jgi:hypothetical protein